MIRACLALGIAALTWMLQETPDNGKKPSEPARRTIDESVDAGITATLSESRSRFVLPAGKSYYLIVNNLGLSESASRIRISSAEDAKLTQLTWAPVRPLASRRTRQEVPVQFVSRREETPSINPTIVDESLSERRTFFLHVTNDDLDDPRGYVPVFAERIAEGDLVRVYRDRQAPLTDDLKQFVSRIVDLMEREIIPRAADIAGRYSDIDSDGKLAILLTPWLDRLQGGRTSVNGFVRGSDFQAGLPRPMSNHADVIYLNANMKPETNLKTLLGHEYLHLVAFSIRCIQSETPLPLEEDWLSEAEAHLAENLLGGDGSNLRHRLEAFLADPAGTPLVVRDYYHRGLWRDDRCRGATYLFIRWLADVYGEDLLKRLLQGNQCGTANIEQATGESFDSLMRHWNIALLHAADVGVECDAPYRYFDSTTGIDVFGKNAVDNVAIAAPNEIGELEFSLAPSGTALIKLDAYTPRDLQLSSYPASRVQLTLIPVEKAPAPINHRRP